MVNFSRGPITSMIFCSEESYSGFKVIEAGIFFTKTPVRPTVWDKINMLRHIIIILLQDFQHTCACACACGII